MSVLNASNNLLSSKMLASLLMAMTLVLSGCGAGCETTETNAQATNDSTGNADDSADAGSEDPVEETPAPAILNLVSQPADATVAEGETHSFVVMVEHENPITVLWSFNGTIVQRSSSTSYVASSAGTYRCMVSDGTTNILCDTFTLTVTPPAETLTINSQPSNALVNEGVDVVMSVSASGVGELSYQWFFNDDPISGATAATLELDAVSSSDEGEYRVVVADALDTLASNVVTVSVMATEEGSGTGEAILVWDRPETRIDESNLAKTDIEAYEIYYSDSESGDMSYFDSVAGGDVIYTASGLSRGTHYFSLVTVDTTGMKSVLSDMVSITIN